VSQADDDRPARPEFRVGFSVSQSLQHALCADPQQIRDQAGQLNVRPLPTDTPVGFAIAPCGRPTAASCASPSAKRRCSVSGAKLRMSSCALSLPARAFQYRPSACQTGLPILRRGLHDRFPRHPAPPAIGRESQLIGAGSHPGSNVYSPPPLCWPPPLPASSCEHRFPLSHRASVFLAGAESVP